jgi:hypothetical protein
MRLRPVLAQAAGGKDGSLVLEPDILLGQNILPFAVQNELVRALARR